VALELTRGEPHLTDDLGGSEVAIEALLRGGAERAVEGAADLRGNAQRAALRLRDEYHFEGLLRVRPEQPLAGTVRGALHRDDLRRAHFGAGAETGAQLLRHIRHFGEAAGPALVDPAHQ